MVISQRSCTSESSESGAVAVLVQPVAHGRLSAVLHSGVPKSDSSLELYASSSKLFIIFCEESEFRVFI